jgi:hypothetical protein
MHACRSIIVCIQPYSYIIIFWGAAWFDLHIAKCQQVADWLAWQTFNFYSNIASSIPLQLSYLISNTLLIKSKPGWQAFSNVLINFVDLDFFQRLQNSTASKSSMHQAVLWVPYFGSSNSNPPPPSPCKKANKWCCMPPLQSLYYKLWRGGDTTLSRFNFRGRVWSCPLYSV